MLLQSQLVLVLSLEDFMFRGKSIMWRSSALIFLNHLSCNSYMVEEVLFYGKAVSCWTIVLSTKVSVEHRSSIILKF